MSRPEFIKVPERTEYYDQAQSWATENSDLLRASRRIAWIVAAAAGGIALLEGAALVALVPYKTTVPYVISVDRQTGFTELAQRLTPGGTLAQKDAIIQSALVQYVLARETFDAADLREQYRKVQLWSTEPVRAAYIRWMARTNLASPINQNLASTTVSITVKGVTQINPTTSLVRFDAVRTDPAATASQVQSYSATISYRFSGEAMAMEDRFINPLGFQVTHYRRDDESVGAREMVTGASRAGSVR